MFQAFFRCQMFVNVTQLSSIYFCKRWKWGSCYKNSKPSHSVNIVKGKHKTPNLSCVLFIASSFASWRFVSTLNLPSNLLLMVWGELIIIFHLILQAVISSMLYCLSLLVLAEFCLQSSVRDELSSSPYCGNYSWSWVEKRKTFAFDHNKISAAKFSILYCYWL